MATLAGTTIASTYPLLLKMASGGVASGLVKVQDGDATDSALSIGTVSIAIDATDKLYLDGGTHTYINESAADIMDFYSGGTHMLSLDKTNGEVCINESSQDINFRVEGNGDALLLFCDAGNDRIGIGTISPGEELHVSGAGEREIKVTSTNDDAVISIDSDTDEGKDSRLLFSSGGTDRGEIVYDHNATAATQKMQFKVGDNAVTSTTILGNGNVGIGTDSPDYELEVEDTAGAVAVGIKAGGTGQASYLRFINSTNHWRLGLVTDDFSLYDNTNTTTPFRVDAGAPNHSLRVLTSGYVGIGTASPNTTLEVTGAITATRASVANLADNGSIAITSSCVNIDANGSARTGIRFAGTGTAGQFIFVNNTGGEALTFHNTAGTALVRGIHADHDTMEANFMGMFVSDGSLWNLIAGGVDSQPDVGLTAS
jgi:hypothetical protein